MKKTLIWLALLLMLAMPAAAAMPPLPEPSGSPIPDWTETTVWEWYDPGQGGTAGWIKDGPFYNGWARLFKYLEIDEDGYYTKEYCNRHNWPIHLVNRAEMAHWCDWEITYNRWDWRIMKPGTYCGDSIGLTVTSNAAINIYGDGFTDLIRENVGEDEDPTDGQKTIKVYYQWSDRYAQTPLGNWLSPDEVNSASPWYTFMTGTDPYAPVPTTTMHLWNKIVVTNENRVCDYTGEGIIYVALANQKVWVKEDGTWMAKGQSWVPTL